MVETTPTNVTDILMYLSSQAGAGVAASLLFAQLRAWFPAPRQRPSHGLLRWLCRALHTPRYALYSSIVLALFVGTGAAGVLAYIQGRSITDAAWGFVAALLSQVWYRHGRMLDLDTWEQRPSA